MNKEERIKRIENAEAKLREAENLRTAALTMKTQYEKEKEKVDEELKELGTTPEKVEETISSIEKEMEKLLIEIENDLPVELLEKMKNI